MEYVHVTLLRRFVSEFNQVIANRLIPGCLADGIELRVTRSKHMVGSPCVIINGVTADRWKSIKWYHTIGLDTTDDLETQQQYATGLAAAVVSEALATNAKGVTVVMFDLPQQPDIGVEQITDSNLRLTVSREHNMMCYEVDAIFGLDFDNSPTVTPLDLSAFNTYQRLTRSTALYTKACEEASRDLTGDVGATTLLRFMYAVLGLAGEAGEVANKAKKLVRDDNSTLTPTFTEAIGKEIGGVLWYCAAVCSELGINLADVAAKNLAELKSRQQRGTLTGSGDNR